MKNLTLTLRLSIWIFFGVLTFASTSNAQISIEPRTANPIICEDHFKPGRLATQAGPIKSFSHIPNVRQSALRLELNDEIILLNVLPYQAWTYSRSKYTSLKTEDMNVYFREAESRLDFKRFYINERSFRGIRAETLELQRRYTSDQILAGVEASHVLNFLVHPRFGLIVVDNNGIVYRLPSEVDALGPQEIVRINQLEEGAEDSFLIETTSGKLIRLYRSRNSSWPAFEARVDGIVDVDPTENPSRPDYEIVHYQEFGLDVRPFAQFNNDYEIGRQRIEVRYDQLYASGFIPGARTAFEGHDRNYQIIEHEGREYIVASFNMGFIVVDLETGEYFEKYLTSDVTLPVTFQVTNLIHLPELGSLFLTTLSGHSRIVNVEELFNRDSSTIAFNRMRPGVIESGDFPISWFYNYQVNGNQIVAIQKTREGFQKIRITVSPDQPEDQVELLESITFEQPQTRVIQDSL